MRVLTSLLTILTVNCATLAGNFDLCILYDPDDPQKGVVVVKPEQGRTKVMLAERVAIASTDEAHVVTVSNFHMLAERPVGTQCISAGSTAFKYDAGTDRQILVNSYPCSLSQASALFPTIPGEEANASLRDNPTPLKWGNMLEGMFITGSTVSKWVVRRSTAPKVLKPANPSAPPPQDTLVNMSFNSAPLDVPMGHYAEMSGKTVILTTGAQGVLMTLTTEKRLSIPEFLEAIESKLEELGLELVEESDVVVRVTTAE